MGRGELLEFYDNLDRATNPVDEGLKGLVNLIEEECMGDQRPCLNSSITHQRSYFAEGPISFGSAS